MPITLLDVILLVVMMISALLAMVRGFMREILSIAAGIQESEPRAIESFGKRP